MIMFTIINYKTLKYNNRIFECGINKKKRGGKIWEKNSLKTYISDINPKICQENVSFILVHGGAIQTAR